MMYVSISGNVLVNLDGIEIWLIEENFHVHYYLDKVVCSSHVEVFIWYEVLSKQSYHSWVTSLMIGFNLCV